MRKSLCLTLILVLTCSCEEKLSNDETTPLNKNCRGEWVEKNEAGLVIKKYEQYWNEGTQSCLTENRVLSQWEESSLKRYKKKIECTPQPQMQSVSLISANNWYKPRNGKIFLDLNAETGQYRRLVVDNSNHAGVKKFQREIGCWYQREDNEIEPVNSTDYGLQILLDRELAASSEIFHPMEIFKYEQTGTTWQMTRFDQNYDIDYTFCPTSTPWEYCTELRNGNIMFYPENLDQTTMDDLKAEALLIRSEFNWREISENEFEDTWSQAITNYVEDGTKKAILEEIYFSTLIETIVDIQPFIDRAWRDYLRGDRPAMPDVSPIAQPFICYPLIKEITLSDGTTGYINGEACYENGEWTFTGV